MTHFNVQPTDFMDDETNCNICNAMYVYQHLGQEEKGMACKYLKITYISENP